MKHGLWSIVTTISITIVCVLGLLVARQTGRISDQTATIWSAAIGTIGTLAAVGAALANAEIAMTLARDSAERAEYQRHEAVRPYFTVQAWWERMFDEGYNESGRMTIRLWHESGGTGFGLTLLLVPQQVIPNLPHYTVKWDDVLRPIIAEEQRIQTGFYGSAEYSSVSDAFTIGSYWWLICRAHDEYGWWWQQRTDLIHLVEWQSSGSPPTDMHDLPIRLGTPTRVSDAYPSEKELQTLRA